AHAASLRPHFWLRTGVAPVRDDHAGTRDSPLAATAYSGIARRGNVLPVQHLGDEEGELQGLRAVQPRIADGLIALIQVILDDRIPPPPPPRAGGAGGLARECVAGG